MIELLQLPKGDFSGMDIGIQPNITLGSLCKALTKGEFFYFYQPIVSLENGLICGAEALVRWKKDDGSIIMPASFIPLAESTGFITEMNQELLPNLLDDLSRLNAVAPGMFVHFNLSSADLETRDLAGFLSRNNLQKNIQPGTFRVEIVESVFMPPVPRVEETIAELASKGIPVVLNDFSAGYTTLSLLSRLPLKAIKLALNIVQRATASKKDFRVLRHLVSMGHQLGLEVISEGIETEEMYDLTLSTGSTSAQGYFFGHPLALKAYLALLEKGPHWSNYPFGIEYLAQMDLIDFRRDVIRAALTIMKYKQDEIRQRALVRLPELDHRSCVLGEWFSGVGREWESQPGFEELSKEHRRMHEIAERLIQAALKDEPRETIMPLIEALFAQANQIAHFLRGIELQGLVNHYKL
jgi:EAL domain-containing protein (putative c-di-GMP-specific phosphodiesterase class I)